MAFRDWDETHRLNVRCYAFGGNFARHLVDLRNCRAVDDWRTIEDMKRDKEVEKQIREDRIPSLVWFYETHQNESPFDEPEEW